MTWHDALPWFLLEVYAKYRNQAVMPRTRKRPPIICLEGCLRSLPDEKNEKAYFELCHECLDRMKEFSSSRVRERLLIKSHFESCK